MPLGLFRRNDAEGGTARQWSWRNTKVEISGCKSDEIIFECNCHIGFIIMELSAPGNGSS